MPRTTITTVAAAAALTLAVGTPALAATHGHTKPTHRAQTHLTLRATQERVTKNDKFKATVVAKLRAHKAPLAAENVELFQRSAGATKWVDTGQGSATGADGTATFTFTQSTEKQKYRVVFTGDSTYRASHSGAITIKRVKASKTAS